MVEIGFNGQSLMAIAMVATQKALAWVVMDCPDNIIKPHITRKTIGVKKVYINRPLNRYIMNRLRLMTPSRIGNVFLSSGALSLHKTYHVRVFKTRSHPFFLSVVEISGDGFLEYSM